MDTTINRVSEVESSLLLTDCEYELITEALSRHFSLVAPVAVKLRAFLDSGEWNQMHTALTIHLRGPESRDVPFSFSSQHPSFFLALELALRRLIDFDTYKDVRMYTSIATALAEAASYLQFPKEVEDSVEGVPTSCSHKFDLSKIHDVRNAIHFVHPTICRDSYLGPISVYKKSELVPLYLIQGKEGGMAFSISNVVVDDGYLILSLQPLPGRMFKPVDWLSYLTFTPLTERCDVMMDPLQAELRLHAYRNIGQSDVRVKAIDLDVALAVLSSFVNGPHRHEMEMIKSDKN